MDISGGALGGSGPKSSIFWNSPPGRAVLESEEKDVLRPFPFWECPITWQLSWGGGGGGVAYKALGQAVYLEIQCRRR